MTRLTIEVQNSRDLTILTAFFKLLNVKILGQEKAPKQDIFEPAVFYKGINVDLTNYKFNRDEANER